MTAEAAASGAEPAPTIDTSIPRSARMWNYWLGGEDNFQVDRDAADSILEVFPQIADVARTARQLLVRVVEHLAGELGVRQFLDVGTGLPTANNTHQVAQRVAKECRVVYVDNDPLVLARSRALLVGSSEGATAYVDADVHDPDTILEHAAETLDFGQPVALVMFGIMGNVTADDEAQAIVKRMVAAVPSNSYLALNDGTSSDARSEAIRRHQDTSGSSYRARLPEQIAEFFDGLDLLEPGVVPTPLWRPGPNLAPAVGPFHSYCGVARKT